MSGSIPFGKVVNIAGYEVEVLERSGKYLVYFYEENGWKKLTIKKGSLTENVLQSRDKEVWDRLYRFADTRDRKYLVEAVWCLKIKEAQRGVAV